MPYSKASQRQKPQSLVMTGMAGVPEEEGGREGGREGELVSERQAMIGLKGEGREGVSVSKEYSRASQRQKPQSLVMTGMAGVPEEEEGRKGGREGGREGR